MAGHHRPGGLHWPAPGYPDEFDDLGPPRSGLGRSDDASPYGAMLGGYGAGQSDPEPDDWYVDEPEPDDGELEPALPTRDDGDGRDGRGGRRREGHRRGNILWRWRRGLFVAALMVMAMIAAGVAAIAQVELPDAAEMQLSSFICTAEVPAGECDGNTAMARLSGEGNREYVRLEDVPPIVINAIIAAEDRSFWEHDGLDPVGIGRALYRDLRGGGVTQGGSTITQQFVKNIYLESDQTVIRKIREAALAIKVEQEMSKEEILEGYINTIYWGRNALGIQAASRAYFNKDVQDLGLPEASYLAGLIRAPSLADANDPEDPDQAEEATRRRGTVLDAMLDEEYIGQAEYDLVDSTDLTTYVTPRQSFRQNTHFWGGADSPTGTYGMEYVTDYVQRQTKNVLVNELGWSEEQAEQEIAGGGLRIYTTIDRTMQQQAYDSVYRAVLANPTDPSAGLVAIDNQGMVKAMVGGRDYYAENNFAQNNFAVMGRDGRQVGSTFKPIALALAAQEGISFEQTRMPAPGELEVPPIEGTQCETRTYRNYSSEDAQTGNLNLFEATAESSNTAFVGLMYELGTRFGPEAVPTMAEELGMDGAQSEGRLSQCLPTVLGAGGSSPLEMAEVYSTFANRGVHREPTIITRIDRVSPGGETANIWAWQPNEQPVLTPEQADLVTYSLEGVVDHGTGTGADVGRPQAGKTGSTSNNKDAWYVGYVPQLTTAVWMGYPEANWIDPECNPAQTDTAADDFCVEEIPPMRDLYGHSTVTGGSLPAQIWATFMSQATANLPPDDFVEPPEELRRSGEELGDAIDAGDQLPTDTTLPPGPPGSGPGPIPSIPITIEPPENTTTSSTTTTTLGFPFPSGSTVPGGDRGEGQP